MSTRSALIILVAAALAVALAIAFFPSQKSDLSSEPTVPASTDVVPTVAPPDAPPLPESQAQRESAEPLQDQGALMVRVLESDGSPSPMQELALLVDTGEGRGLRVNPVATTDQDGWARVDRAVALQFHKSLAKYPNAREVSIGVRGAEESYISTPVDLEHDELIELQLKPCTRILLHFIGFPGELGPTLVLGRYDAMSRNEKIEGVPLEDNWWRFDYVVPGETWTAVPVRPHYQEGRSRPTGWRGTGLPGFEFEGPRFEGETARVEFRMEHGPIIAGRFINSEGEPISLGADDGNDFQVAGYAGGAPDKDVYLWVEGFEDGRFLARPIPSQWKKGSLISGINQVHFWWKSRGTKEEGGSSHVSTLPSLSAIVKIEAEVEGDFVDVGDVTLSTESPLLSVHVSDHQGAPIERAYLKLEVLREVNGRAPSWAGFNYLGVQRTDQNGEGLFFAPSWEEARWFGSSSRARAALSGELAFRLTVTVRDYAPHIQELNSSTEHVNAVLGPAAGLTGTIDPGPLPSRELRLSLVETGAPVTRSNLRGRTSLAAGFSNAKPEEGPQSFELIDLQPGSYDFVVSFDSLEWEILRIPGVAVGAGHDGRLDSIRLVDHLSFLQVSLLDVDGIPIQEDDLGDKFASCQREFTREGVVASTRARLLWEASTVLIPFPKDAPSFDGEIRIAGCALIPLEDLAPGQYSFAVVPFQQLTLRLRGLESVPSSVEYYLNLRDLADTRDRPELRDRENRTAPVALVPGPGHYQLRWHGKGANDRFDEHGSVEFEITDEDLLAGEIYLQAPVSFLEWAAQQKG
jgi:hypothetical protein